MGQPDTNHTGLFKLAAQPGCAQGPEGLVRCRSLILALECRFTSRFNGTAFPPRCPSVFLLLLERLGIHSSGLKSKSTGWTVSQAEASVRFTLQVLIVGETGFSFSNAWICTLTGGSVPRVLVPSNLSSWTLSYCWPACAIEVPAKDGTLGSWHPLLAAPCSAQLSHKEIIQDILLQERTCPITSLGTGTSHVTANPPVASPFETPLLFTRNKNRRCGK